MRQAGRLDVRGRIALKWMFEKQRVGMDWIQLVQGKVGWRRSELC